MNVNFRGIKEFDLFVSPNEVDLYMFAGNFSLNKANETSESTSDPEAIQEMNFLPTNVRHIKFEIISNISADVPRADDVVGLSEVRFEGTVPETTTLAMSALGIVSLGSWRVEDAVS